MIKGKGKELSIESITAQLRLAEQAIWEEGIRTSGRDASTLLVLNQAIVSLNSHVKGSHIKLQGSWK